LESIINDGYRKLKKATELDGIFVDLDVLFSEKLPIVFEGVYAYCDSEGYHYASVERGEMKIHKIADDLFEISYWIYSDITFKMAVDYEYKNRIKNQDPRRLYFKKQLELLGILGEDFRKRGEIEIEGILKNNPYDDSIFS
jgi:hypothetical protein